MKIILDIQGMENTTSADNLEKALYLLPGVKEVHINFEAQEAVVEHDETQTPPEIFVKIIEKSGYRASATCK